MDTLLSIYFIALVVMLFHFKLGKYVFRIGRPNGMKALADELGLAYQIKGATKTVKKKNIISGVLNGEKISIYDLDTNTVLGESNGATTFYKGTVPAPVVSPAATEPHSVTYINGKYYKDKVVPYLGIKSIRKIVKKEITLKEYTNVTFNKGMFTVIVVMGLFVSWVGYAFLYDIYSKAITVTSVLTINILFILMAIYLSKKSAYKIPIKKSDVEPN